MILLEKLGRVSPNKWNFARLIDRFYRQEKCQCYKKFTFS